MNGTPGKGYGGKGRDGIVPDSGNARAMGSKGPLSGAVAKTSGVTSDVAVLTSMPR